MLLKDEQKNTSRKSLTAEANMMVRTEPDSRSKRAYVFFCILAVCMTRGVPPFTMVPASESAVLRPDIESRQGSTDCKEQPCC